MMLEKKYDVICPLGQWCATALHIKRHNLRLFSMPLDWMEGGAVDLAGYVKIVTSDFGGFMEKCNLHKTGMCGEERDEYWDDGVKLQSVHDFVHGTPFDEAYPLVRAKYDRRINRFYREVSKAKSVLFVHMARTVFPDDAMMVSALDKLREKFPSVRVDLLVVTCKDVPEIAWREVGDGLYYVEANIWKPEIDERYGDKEVGDEIFGKIRLRGKWRNILRKRILKMRAKIVCACHLTSEGRRAARQRYFEAHTKGGE